MADYLPDAIAEFALWMVNFADRLGVHGPTLDVSPAEITDVQNDSGRYSLEVAAVDTARNAFRAAVAARDEDREDTIEPRIRPLVQRIQNHPAMTDDIRRDLGITVPDRTPTPLGPSSIDDAGAPLLEVDIGQRKRAIIHWGPNPGDERRNARPAGVRGVRLWFWLGAGEPPAESDWEFLDEDNRSPYTHVTMNPSPLTITFRAAYVDRMNRVGSTSDPVTVTINP